MLQHLKYLDKVLSIMHLKQNPMGILFMNMCYEPKLRYQISDKGILSFSYVFGDEN